MKMEIQRFPDAEALAAGAAALIFTLADRAIRSRWQFNLALSGGSTPARLFTRLTQPAGHAIWRSTHVYWSDERCVPPDHPQSNFRLAQETLLSQVPIPPGNIHRIPGELSPEDAACQYREQLAPVERFDLILLGLGEDGHTASLFPGSPALRVRRKSAVAVHVPQLDSWRVTLTYPVLNRARNILFLVSGAAKADVLHRVLSGADLPAAHVHPRLGRLFWFVDEEAYPSV